MAEHEVELPNPDEIEEQRSKAFTRRTALVTAVYAVFLAIVSLGGNNASKELSLSQQQASDQWAFYQSKAMREHLYHLEALRQEADLAERGSSMAPEVRQRREAFLGEMRKEEARYGSEKNEIEEKARDLERERDLFRRKDPYFDFGEVLLQVAIVLASMSILTGARPIFWTSVIAAVTGALLGLDGFLLFVRLPFF